MVPLSEEEPVWAKAALDVNSMKESMLMIIETARLDEGLTIFMESSIGKMLIRNFGLPRGGSGPSWNFICELAETIPKSRRQVGVL